MNVGMQSPKSFVVPALMNLRCPDARPVVRAGTVPSEFTQESVGINNRSGRSRPGWTLIELLVCIAIFAVMLGTILPAIQNARESARSTHCRSNLAQLGEAFHAYHMAHGSLPSGSVDAQSPVTAGPDRFAWGWAIQLLPQLGEQNRAAGLNASLGVAAPVNSVILAQTPVFLICPSGSQEVPIGYAGCHNDRRAPIQTDNNGALTLNSHVQYEELVDGLHHTLLLGEAADVRWAEGTYGSLRNISSGFGEPYVKVFVGIDAAEAAERTDTLRTKIKEEQSPDPSEDDNDDSEVDEMLDEDLDTRVESGVEAGGDEEAHQPPPPPAAEPIASFSRMTGFWPAHRDTGNFLLADGSVRAVSKSVNLEILGRLANRHDHQAVGEF